MPACPYCAHLQLPTCLLPAIPATLPPLVSCYFCVWFYFLIHPAGRFFWFSSFWDAFCFPAGRFVPRFTYTTRFYLSTTTYHLHTAPPLLYQRYACLPRSLLPRVLFRRDRFHLVDALLLPLRTNAPACRCYRTPHTTCTPPFAPLPCRFRFLFYYHMVYTMPFFLLVIQLGISTTYSLD